MHTYSDIHMHCAECVDLLYKAMNALPKNIE